MTPADCRTESRNCFELAQIAKSEAERLALRAEGRRLAALADTIPEPTAPVREPA